MSLSGQWRWALWELEALTGGWHITSAHPLCTNVFVSQSVFISHIRCFTGQILYTDRRPFAARGRTELSYLVKWMDWLCPHYKTATQRLWSALSFSIRGPLWHVHVQLKERKINSSLKWNITSQSSCERIWVGIIYIPHANSEFLICNLANESEVAHVLCWRGHFVPI